MIMSALPILLFSFALHVVCFTILIMHMRAEARRVHLPVIGRDPVLTEALHRRLLRRPPDWLNRAVMRAKILAWLKSNTEGRP